MNRFELWKHEFFHGWWPSIDALILIGAGADASAIVGDQIDFERRCIVGARRLYNQTRKEIPMSEDGIVQDGQQGVPDETPPTASAEAVGGADSASEAIELTQAEPRYRDDLLEQIFTFQNDPAKIPHYLAIRSAALEFAKVVRDHTPECPDQTVAIRKIRECVMTANAAVALDGLS